MTSGKALWPTKCPLSACASSLLYPSIFTHTRYPIRRDCSDPALCCGLSHMVSYLPSSLTQSDSRARQRVIWPRSTETSGGLTLSTVHSHV
ncbi:hypothetical protein HETIRDRAFT_174965 [Heterobasidion irregulare TC 32-1]|uniref:Uncharacterized protein n=1 Tax=Heterobasidion irregulare (strain TC 32-1) TaxID=747525 RepID=W4JTZ9_HETIT|nr:uncharacterized protein HETIRDRAFT_174965 [Heterobasidion irregulare TC 32-1]ETW76929.1 hypothetical protein HETIRDRAFT_174965 [Heterobasidion irregulare TC 32-1]